ncbi:NEDD8-activating enzyme E1 regulatory subunit AXR1-like [Lycium ferocissimum]|uniref:NEDD8-activating enzyme E1 regulatory subunit AXR1-like n=1 Tax=Lycium ferocissimum TaxID=112874 RepID=UPI002816868B|nr:NEDD8-activating enzyme E1 regulatory subunit AXR1-like [Lycium ferocissimum]
MAEPKVKYDRQLRIWGEQGQAALEKASICLLNCGPTGSETLKNLVLGGVGSITVVDGSKVEVGDLGNNFMVDESSVGQSKAQCVCAFLQELNDAVKAKFIEEHPEELIEMNPSFFSQFTLVIATQVVEDSMVKLDRICREENIILIFARSYGLMGLVRISVKEHTVIESKPDHFLDDLRLNNPWPELRRFADTIDLNTTDAVEHKHTPYIIILVKMAEEWANTHGGKLPSTREDKKQFKDLIKSKMITMDEENYKEAMEASFKLFSPQGISPNLQKIIDDSCAEVDSNSSDFWVMVAALKVCRYRLIEDEFNSPVQPELQKYLTDEDHGTLQEANSLKVLPENTAVGLYILLRAADRFAANYSKFPGQFDGEMDEDISRLKTTAVGLLSELGCNGSALSEDLINEMCRYGASELHAVAAFVGGVASQEVIKLITRQFIPMSGTFIFNGIDHKSQLLLL